MILATKSTEVGDRQLEELCMWKLVSASLQVANCAYPICYNIHVAFRKRCLDKAYHLALRWMR